MSNDVWPQYNGHNECNHCNLVSNCVDDDKGGCCIHQGLLTLQMCSRCRLRKEVMLK